VSRRRPYHSGVEFARRHVQAARELSHLLGGTDEDVKRYFFALTPRELSPILDAYERENGRPAREYAEATIPLWRSGARKMSGLNAERLFRLLPRFMPIRKKYELVESLWTQAGPRTEYSIAFGPNASPDAVGDAVARHLVATVNSHTIPDALQRRFVWLADGDVQVMQQLLNHFLERDRQQVLSAITPMVAQVLQVARDSDFVQKFTRELEIGGHKVTVFLDPRATEVTISEGSPLYLAGFDSSWLWMIAAAIFFLIVFILK
jgi:hypothetical protein